MVTSHSNALGLNLEDSVRKWFAYLYLLRYLPTNLYRIPVCYLFVYRFCILHVCMSISLYIVASQLVHISDMGTVRFITKYIHAWICRSCLYIPYLPIDPPTDLLMWISMLYLIQAWHLGH